MMMIFFMMMFLIEISEYFDDDAFLIEISEYYDDDDVAAKIVADQKVKVLKMLLLIERSKCRRCC